MTICKTKKFAVLAVMSASLVITACGNQPLSEDEQGATELATQAPDTRPQGFAAIKQAAAQGDMEAQYQLGLWYEEDHPESPRDLVRAYAWYKLSAEQGDFGAKYAMERFEAQLTNEERATAEDLVGRWALGDALEK
ncbi:MAG: hypothetical protein PHR16_08090 [Methylovulum sp.]|nr:hypothetical protein [Methylovulum sp.]